jgi:CheY-like chemotaxis protein
MFLRNSQEGLEQLTVSCLQAQVASQEIPDLILLDIHMPVIDGFEVLNALAKIKQTNLVLAKVVVLTASSHPDDIEEMKSLGVKHYLEKPVTEDNIFTFDGINLIV